MDSCTHSGEER